MNVRKNGKVGIRRPGWRAHFHYWGYCVYKSCHFSIMTCEMQSGQGWWRKRINCKALRSYQGTPSAPAAPSSAELSREGVDDSIGTAQRLEQVRDSSTLRLMLQFIRSMAPLQRALLLIRRKYIPKSSTYFCSIAIKSGQYKLPVQEGLLIPKDSGWL